MAYSGGIAMIALLKLLTSPEQGWASIAEKPPSLFSVLGLQLTVLALLPAAAWFYGVTHAGWTLPSGEHTFRMTEQSASVIIVLFYGAMIVGTVALGAMIHWMSATYGAEPSWQKSMTLATYTNMPLFITGCVGLWPALWFDLILGTFYAVYLLYVGIPPMMGVPRERGYLFASAALAVGLVMFIGLMGVTVMLWEMGAMPVFTD
jgi:hypothetical protein